MKTKIRDLLDELLLEQVTIERFMRESQIAGKFFKTVDFFEQWKTVTIRINTLKELL